MYNFIRSPSFLITDVQCYILIYFVLCSAQNTNFSFDFFFHLWMDYLCVQLNFQKFGDFYTSVMISNLILIFNTNILYILNPFKFVEAWFMVQWMEHLGKCSLWSWKEYVFCCYLMQHSINISMLSCLTALIKYFLVFYFCINYWEMGLKFSVIISDFSISTCDSLMVFFCFPMYFEAFLLDMQMFRIIMFFWWPNPLSLGNNSLIPGSIFYNLLFVVNKATPAFFYYCVFTFKLFVLLCFKKVSWKEHILGFCLFNPISKSLPILTM